MRAVANKNNVTLPEAPTEELLDYKEEERVCLLFDFNKEDSINKCGTLIFTWESKKGVSDKQNLDKHEVFQMYAVSNDLHN